MRRAAAAQAACGLALLGMAWGCSGPARVPPPVEPVGRSRLLALIRSSGAPVTIVNVWATWCVPCAEELPSLVRLRREYADSGFRLILVSADAADEADSVLRPALSRLGVDFLTYVSTAPDDSVISALGPGWSGALPASFVYGPGGERTGMMVGRTSEDSFRTVIRRGIRSAGVP